LIILATINTGIFSPVTAVTRWFSNPMPSRNDLSAKGKSIPMALSDMTSLQEGFPFRMKARSHTLKCH
jgi:hypothetical protein